MQTTKPIVEIEPWGCDFGCTLFHTTYSTIKINQDYSVFLRSKVQMTEVRHRDISDYMIKKDNNNLLSVEFGFYNPNTKTITCDFSLNEEIIIKKFKDIYNENLEIDNFHYDDNYDYDDDDEDIFKNLLLETTKHANINEIMDDLCSSILHIKNSSDKKIFQFFIDCFKYIILDDNNSHIQMEQIKIEPAYIYNNNYWIKKNIERWYELFITNNKRGNPTQLTEGIIKNKKYMIEKNKQNEYDELNNKNHTCEIIIDGNDVIYL